jgi:hypothetical protein
MATSLATKTLGGTDAVFAWLLQSGGESLATGFRVALGNGTESLLWVDDTGIGVVNGGGFRTVIRGLATANRVVELADAGGVVFPELTATLGTDATNSTTTPAAVSGWTVALAALGIYEFEMLLVCESAATGTGVQVQLTGPSGEITWITYTVEQPTTTTLTTSNMRRQNLSALGTVFAATDFPAANVPTLLRVKGMVRVGASAPASAMGVSFNSEVGASQVTVKAGSFMRFRKVN